MATWTYDATVDALYVSFAEAPVDRTVPVGDSVMVDFTADDQLVGVEVLGVSTLVHADMAAAVEQLPKPVMGFVARLVKACRESGRVASSRAATIHPARVLNRSTGTAEPAGRTAVAC